LIVDLFEKFAGLRFLPDFDAEWDVGRLKYVAPEASHQNVVF
jgi:hypothetical protein